MHRLLLVLLLLPMVACIASPDTSELPSAPTPEPETVAEPVVDPISTEPTDENGAPVANIVSVAVTGEAGNYTFAVTISSADTGCDQYSDWWEVADAQTGELIYRRILAHSHVDEQPFTRSGGPVPIAPDQNVIIRAHMGGLQSNYGGEAYGGSVSSGFEPVVDSLPSLEAVEPLPRGCTF